MKTYLWTKLKARLQLVKTNPGNNLNWFLLPGGPGLGSESLTALSSSLQVPGRIWHLDLPGDGSNLTEDIEGSFSKWQEALIEAVSSMDKVILVGHSTGGMYALSTPALEDKLTGLVLLDSAPDASWQQSFMDYSLKNPIPEATRLHEIYQKNPSNSLLKSITELSAVYSFNEKSLEKGLELFGNLPFNYQTCEWSAAHFDSTYKAAWVPRIIPALILSGEEDRIIPSNIFESHPEFDRPNILIRKIKEAGHFPWIDDAKAVNEAFATFCALVCSLEEA